MSYPRFNSRPLQKHAQRGAAFIVMLVILILGVSAVLVSALNSAGVKIERDVKTTEALALARDTLISKAVTYDDYPGSLPCPDTNDDGESDSLHPSECPQYIGRLPWKTLGLPDLRDAAGEKLWYTLSRNVRRYAGVRPLNSDTAGADTAGTLTVTGSSTESNLLAIVFAPGDNVSGQSRSDNNAACSTTSTSIPESRCAANYLEGSNNDLSNSSTQNLNYQNANTAALLNDRLATVSRDQLMERTEKRVGAEIRNILQTYYNAWGAFPFPATFEAPSSSTFTGQTGTYEGLLPVGDNVQPTWASIPTVSFSGSGSVSYCELRNGSAAYSRWRCNSVNISAGETITISGTLNNVGRGLWRPYNVGNICEVRARNSSGTNVLTTTVLDNVIVTGTLNADSSATIVFQAKGKTGYGTLQRIELRDILDFATAITSNSNTSSCPPSSTNAAIPAWLFDDVTDGNNWHHVAYYSVAEEFAPGGDHTCTPTPCLTINGQGGANAIPAVVIMTGRTLSGAHPSGTLGDYLEGENATTGDHIFENQPRSTTFNDQVISVSP